MIIKWFVTIKSSAKNQKQIIYRKRFYQGTNFVIKNISKFPKKISRPSYDLQSHGQGQIKGHYDH